MSGKDVGDYQCCRAGFAHCAVVKALVIWGNSEVSGETEDAISIDSFFEKHERKGTRQRRGIAIWKVYKDREQVTKVQ